ncbi:MAG: esterase [Leptolyngbyaceae cyanobacterium T60_A2020_046]|nr:esterase [Leptolyngbyaceae cyanobacterium T60_A2020_046]
MDYLYLHGFASGPQSSKAQFLRDRFHACGQTLTVLDLNQNDFGHLTLSRQIQQGMDWIADRAAVTVIGSSFGGLTAAWLAQVLADRDGARSPVVQLVLLAPAFQFLAQWLPRLGEEAVTQWRTSGWLSVYHYTQQQQCPLAYDFVTDAQRYDDSRLVAPVPTLILHGLHDDVIAIQASRDYAAARPWVRLVELDSDHGLLNAGDQIWAEIRTTLAL